jgi:hypothetical protein
MEKKYKVYVDNNEGSPLGWYTEITLKEGENFAPLSLSKEILESVDKHELKMKITTIADEYAQEK